MGLRLSDGVILRQYRNVAKAETWGADVLQTVSGSHVGPLLGREASGIAAQAVEWLNRAAKAG